jgi:cytochrome c-type biogenesis protein CcmF
MEYFNEHLLPGQIGHLLVVLSFVTALISTIAYFFTTHQRDTPAEAGWRILGRYGFVLHGLTTFGVIGVLFYILTGKMYEYQYAWANVSDDLPMQYVFSAFWKEQQGSFLLWSFWHIVLGVVLIVRSQRWEGPVMTIIALAETFIASMMLGLYFGDFRLGASPFDLLRDVMDAPIFAQADYLTKVKGQGLNPLLQNYWMTIHPPTLFLGFASTIVPFAYAMAGLWTREHREWLRPALQWSLFSGAILGTGILMGGAWAYEALSFAGYWAWDPVENASLVPWLTLVAGIHTNLVARATGYSIRSTYAFYLMTFLLILYSTYLTRSGILGDTSAHAFTEMGLGFQLVLFMVVFSLLGVVGYVWRARGIPRIEKEEKFASREFWMFMGSLVLLLSAILITGATSLPVWNKTVESVGLKGIVPLAEGQNRVMAALATLFSGEMAILKPVEHHNGVQLGIAIFMGLLSGVGQWMRFNERNWAGWAKKFGTHLAIAVVGGAALTWLNAQWIHITDWRLFVLLFAGMFTLVANLDYLVSMVRGNLKLAASAVSHIGFGALLLGILATGLGKRWISTNAFAMEGIVEGMGKDAINKNVMLIKEATIPVQDGFSATYLSDTIDRQTRTFRVLFEKRDANGDLTGEKFLLTPNVMYDRQFSKVVASNPSTQHYWNYDIFTHVPALPKGELDPEFAKQQEDSLQYAPYEALVGDTIFTKKNYVIVEGITKKPQHPDYTPQKGDLAFGLQLRACSLDDPKGYPLAPMMYLRPGTGGFALAASAPQLQMKVKMTEKSMEKIFQLEENLRFTQHKMRQGEVIDFQGFKIQLAQVNREVKHPNYDPESGDIAVAAELRVTAPDGQTGVAQPVFLVRGNQPFSLKDDIASMGLHFQFDNINPQTGAMGISVASSTPEQRSIPLQIAENAGRVDYIVLEAIVFPGINLVWIGCILMLLGMALGLWRRLSMRD